MQALLFCVALVAGLSVHGIVQHATGRSQPTRKTAMLNEVALLIMSVTVGMLALALIR